MYYVADVIHAPDVPIPPDKRLTRYWTAFGLPPSGEPATLSFATLEVADAADLPNPTMMRLTVAIDHREETLVEASLTASERVIGYFDIRYAHIFQPFELAITRDDAAQLAAEGLTLRMAKGESPIWLLHNGHWMRGKRSFALAPHILAEVDSDRHNELYTQLTSLASLQFFGWQEGCVLDGMLALRDAGIVEADLVDNAVIAHLLHFFDDDNQLDYEDDWSRPKVGEVYGIECTLPFAVLYKLDRNHTALESAVSFWFGAGADDGGTHALQDGDMLSAEGNYTLAYPMAVLGVTWPRLYKLAFQQLRVRRDKLWLADDFYLRVYDDGSRTFKGWCRGVAWYLLGLARTLIELPDFVAWADIDDWKHELARAAAWAVRRQLPSGLWAVFVDEPDTPPDTSGSAGIAAALALGARHGLLGAEHRAAAEKTLNALWGYLAPDGFLRGVAQVNKAGEALQRSDYRVISQMGMGLMAQLIAALDQQGKHD
jgi:hypothetical protein